MKQLTTNETRTLQALIKMYEDTKEYGFIQNGATGVAKQFKVTYYSYVSTTLLELNLIGMFRGGFSGVRAKWISDVRPTYLTAIKISKKSLEAGAESLGKLKNSQNTNILIESKMNKKQEVEKFTKRDDFINMFDNIISENKESNLKTIELKKDLTNANKDKIKLNDIILDYKSKHLESYTTKLLFGLIKITTKLNYK